MFKKAAKNDIAAIEYALADLDPNEGETPEDAKARYLTRLEKFKQKPTMLLDSGNGIQGLWKLQERIVLGAPIENKDKNGELNYAPADQAKIDDVEARIKAVMEGLGATAGTQNIDRILRLPGTINLPNATKRKAGRTKCQTKLLWFNCVSYSLEDFPLPQKVKKKQDAEPRASKASMPRALSSMLFIPDAGAAMAHAEYASRSELMFAFLTGALRAGANDDRIIAAIMDEAHAGHAIYEHAKESGGQNYAETQIAKAMNDIEPPAAETDKKIIRIQGALARGRERAARHIDDAQTASIL